MLSGGTRTAAPSKEISSPHLPSKWLPKKPSRVSRAGCDDVVAPSRLPRTPRSCLWETNRLNVSIQAWIHCGR